MDTILNVIGVNGGLGRKIRVSMVEMTLGGTMRTLYTSDCLFCEGSGKFAYFTQR